jgi:hypothetical protein
MKAQTRFMYFGLIVLLALLASLALPVTARADGAPPPPPASPAGTDASVKSPATPATSLSQVPADTSVVAVNKKWRAEPLATQAAAKIVDTGDPIWCKAGTAPVAASVNCTASSPDLASLIATLAGASQPTQNGTIWILLGPDTSAVNLDGGAAPYSTWSNYALTLQGGWDGSSSGAITGTSDFSNRIVISNWNNDLTINDIAITASGVEGLHITTTGNIRVHNVTSTHNPAGLGAMLDNGSFDISTGSLTVDHSDFSNNASGGLIAYSRGVITLTDVTANSSQGGYGAQLYTNWDGTTKGINVNSSTFNNNYSDGLDAVSNGNITLNGVSASHNSSGSGANLYIYGWGMHITIGSSTFSDNYYDGLLAMASNIALNGVTADSNIGNGAHLDTLYWGGSTSVSSSNFNENGNDGLDVYSGINITLKNVTASFNSGAGSFLSDMNNVYSIDVDSSTFNNNSYDGLDISSAAAINITNSEFNKNGSELDPSANGLAIFGPETNGPTLSLISNGGSPVTVACSNAGDNTGYGIYDVSPNPLTLNGVIFSGNGSGTYFYPGSASVNSDGCAGGGNDTGKNPVPVSLPLHIINVTGGEANGLDCTQYSGTELILPDHDSAIFPCPISDSASLGPLTSDALPGTLPGGDTYVSAFITGVTKNGSSSSPVNGPITVSFAIPDNMKNANLAILVWDGSKWVEVPGHMTADGHFEALTNLTGIFVLVSK